VDTEEAELIKAQDAVNAHPLGSGAVSAGEIKSKKLDLIPDYVTTCFGRFLEEDADELVTKKGLSFKLQGKRKKLEPGEVSIAQWLSANIVILEKLTPSFSSSQVKEYLKYTRQVGDLLQVYTSESVFLLDDHHRREVYDEDIRWNDVSGHLERFYLERLRGSGGNAGSSSSSGASAKSKRNRFAHPCTRYNTKEGCNNSECKFLPICNYKGCRGNHPRHEHEFRTGKAASTVATGAAE
jgi:hypothetical protein